MLVLSLKRKTWTLCATYPALPGHISFFPFVSLWDYFARGIRGNKGKFGLLRLPGHILVEDI